MTPAAPPRLSVFIAVRNEEARLAACLEKLGFADEIVVLLDGCDDGSGRIAEGFGARTIEGAFEIEGARRNFGLSHCRGDWILEVDADEHVSDDLAAEVRAVIAATRYDWHEIPVDNYIGARLVRRGWGGSFGKAAYPGLFRRGIKHWGAQRVHPAVTFDGARGPMLTARVRHYVDRDISDMICRLDRYSSARARDLRDSGKIGSLAGNVRRLFSRFFKCYVRRKGYREGGLGLLIALCAGLYPLLSHLKARYETE